MKRLLAIAMLVAAAAVAGPSPAQPAEYSELFESLRPGLFTVEVVDRVSNNKNAQGSAFVVGEDALMATNYHVVSEYVLDPERYSLRFRDSNGRSGDLGVVAVDVVHDLALVRAGEAAPEIDPGAVFELAESMPAVGATVLALGNPYDIGISLVPGTYNGLLENQYRKNIHFTGALNPGMSGGPAVDQQGRVVGINVAGAGNSVSFLVPVAELERLIEGVPEQPGTLEAMRERVVDRIIAHQAGMVDDLLAGDWSPEPFGPMMIPREIRPWISCSGGGSDADSETPWLESHSNCTLNDRIYLSRSLDTGPLEMIFGWYSSETLNEFQFANVFEQNTFVPFNRTGDDDVTEFECREDWVEYPNLEPVAFKASYCLRAYLDYPGLYDVLFVARALMNGSEGLHVHYTLAGIDRDSAMALHERVLGALEWK